MADRDGIPVEKEKWVTRTRDALVEAVYARRVMTHWVFG